MKQLTIQILMIVSTYCFSYFIDTTSIYEPKAQTQINMILYENRIIPIILVTYYNQSSNLQARNIVNNLFTNQSIVAFSLLVDCKAFIFDMGGSLGYCQSTNQLSSNSTNDPYYTIKVYTPNILPSKYKNRPILQKHNLTEIKPTSINSQDIIKLITIEYADQFNYIQNQKQFQQFIGIENQNIHLSRKPKLVYFNSQLSIPIYLQKIGIRMYKQIDFAICNVEKIIKYQKIQIQALIIYEYNYDRKKYQPTVLDKNNPEYNLKQYLKQNLLFDKNTDKLLDLQPYSPKIYNISKIKYINSLISFGKTIILEVSITTDDYSCPQLLTKAQTYGTIFNYVCFDKNNISALSIATVSIPKKQYRKNIFIVIQTSLKDAKLIKSSFNNFYTLLTQLQPQTISNQKQLNNCLSQSQSSNKNLITYYFNEQSHQAQISIIQYLNTIQEITQLVTFCKISQPSNDITSKYLLKQNALKSFQYNLVGSLLHNQQSRVNKYYQIKNFVQFVVVQKISQIIEARILNNKIQRVDSQEKLSQYCYSSLCVIGLIATSKSRSIKQIQILQKMKLLYADQGYQIIWIDAVCHKEISKQLHLFKKRKPNKILRSYVFTYQESDTSFSMWRSKKIWDEKSLAKWFKNIKKQNNKIHLKNAIKIDDTQCKSSQIIKQQQEAELSYDQYQL